MVWSGSSLKYLFWKSKFWIIFNNYWILSGKSLNLFKCYLFLFRTRNYRFLLYVCKTICRYISKYLINICFEILNFVSHMGRRYSTKVPMGGRGWGEIYCTNCRSFLSRGVGDWVRHTSKVPSGESFIYLAKEWEWYLYQRGESGIYVKGMMVVFTSKGWGLYLRHIGEGGT